MTNLRQETDKGTQSLQEIKMLDTGMYVTRYNTNMIPLPY